MHLVEQITSQILPLNAVLGNMEETLPDISQDARYNLVLEALVRLHAGCANPEAMRAYERGMVAEFLVMLDAALLASGGGIEITAVR